MALAKSEVFDFDMRSPDAVKLRVGDRQRDLHLSVIYVWATWT